MDYIQSFESYLREGGKADKTIESYTGDVTGYIHYIAEKKITFDGQLNRFTVVSYKSHLLEKNYAPTTINKKLNSLQSMNLYLIESGQMTDMVINLTRDRIKIAKGSEKSVEVYSDVVLDALMFHLETNAKSLRDKVMMQLLLYTIVAAIVVVIVVVKAIVTTEIVLTNLTKIRIKRIMVKR